jgi:phospholipid/cholesterol/gamma-HCH transport system permease protein
MAAVTVERQNRSAVVRVHGDVIVPIARELYVCLRQVARRRDVTKLVIDFGDAGRVDSSAVAAIELVKRQIERNGKQLQLDGLGERQRAAFELVPQASPPPPLLEEPGVLERVGDTLYDAGGAALDLARLAGDGARQVVAVAARRRRLPAGAVTEQIGRMGVDAVFIVALLALLLGLTTAFQGAVQLRRFGADVFIADMVGISMVRELAPLVTAIILTGRTGAAIAAELGTMKVGSELDALRAMGISPVRFLVVPRLIAITLVVPALTLMAMFVGIGGGMIVAASSLDLPPTAYWVRIVDRVDLSDYIHGLSKSFVFAWIIGLAGCHLGMNAGRDASSVGRATTRTVVASIFFIILVDAIFATVSTSVRFP